VRREAEVLAQAGALDETAIADLCAGFQQAVLEVLADRTARAIAMARDTGMAPGALVVAGGVAANAALRTALETTAAAHDLALIAPPLALCTDNAAMIAWAGIEKLRLGESDPLDFKPRPRWPLDPQAAA